MLGLSLPTKHNICIIITSGLLVYLCGLFVENAREAERDADKATLLWTPECLDHSLTVQECKCLFSKWLLVWRTISDGDGVGLQMVVVWASGWGGMGIGVGQYVG